MDPLVRLVSEARSAAECPLMVVLLHGLGSNEGDLFTLAPELDPRLTVVALRAPFEYGFGGFAWFDVQWDSNGLTVNSDQAQASVERLCQELPVLQSDLGVKPENTVLGGFSQGAMMTLGVLLERPELIGGAMLLSGSMIPRLVNGERPVERPVFQSHGTMDPVLPVQLGRQVRDLLLSRSAPLTYREYAMAHEVNMPCLRDAERWLHQQVERMCRP